MNSKIAKAPPKPVEMTDDNISGKMLHRKLEVWCAAEPNILMWEISYEEAPIKAYVSIEGKDLETSGSRWVIEFQFTRSNSATPTLEGLFADVAIIAGTIKNSYEMIDGVSQPVYLLSVYSRSLKGDRTYVKATDLWKQLTRFGLKKPKTEPEGDK